MTGLRISPTTPQARGEFNPALIRPPGSRGERDFLARCIACGACMKVCPTAALQPALSEAGLEQSFIVGGVFSLKYFSSCSAAFSDVSLDEVVQVLQDTEAIYVRTEFSEKMLCTMPEHTVVKAGEKVYASIRPEDVEIYTESTQTKENLFKGTIVHKAYLGNFLYFFVNVNDTMIRAQVPHHLPQEEGQELYLCLNPQKSVVLL